MHTLPPAIVDIKHEAPYKVTERHVSPFNSLFDNLQAQDLKRKEEQKRVHEAKIKKDTDSKRKERKRKAHERAVRDKRAESDRLYQDRHKEQLAPTSGDNTAQWSSNDGTTERESLAGRPTGAGENAGQNAQGAGTQNNEVGSTWDNVSPLQASQYMASKTPVSVDRWLAIINAESSNDPYIVNSLGCYGYLQLHPVHGVVSQMTPQQYLETAVQVYNSQGLSAWEVVTIGKA